MRYELGPAMPTTWELVCGGCRERLTITLPPDIEAGFSGLISCEHSHLVAFRFDGVALLPDSAFEVRHPPESQFRG